ncbi:MAG: hypothetical protein H6774_01035 [Pseudomonadales bacterium]|nr:hypothetical protein [Pseudomonadales bacterium]
MKKLTSRKMSHGIKISHKGFNVTDLDKERSVKAVSKTVLPHLLSGLALPYLLGAKTQAERYVFAASQLKARPTMATMSCLHEASTLFEDLNTVVIYMRKSGKDHKDHQLWMDIRNHIRHAVREEFDKENDSVKNERAQRLGLDPKLQISIGFDIDAIKVGATLVEVSRIKKYLAWAEGVIVDILAKAKEDGSIEGIRVIKKP